MFKQSDFLLLETTHEAITIFLCLSMNKKIDYVEESWYRRRSQTPKERTQRKKKGKKNRRRGG